jgi:hypothetical protein
MALTNNFKQWYTSDNHDRLSVTAISSAAEEAFQAAVKRFTEDRDQRKDVGRIMHNATSLQDVQEIVKKSIDEYKKKRKHPKAIKWLQKSAKSIDYYSKVFDVFVPRNPEYVSLAWGAMKFLLTVSKV